MRKTNHASFLSCRRRKVERCQLWKCLGKVWAILTITHLFCVMNGKPAVLYENISACWGTCSFFETLWDRENNIRNEAPGTPKTLIKERCSSSLAAQGQRVLSWRTRSEKEDSFTDKGPRACLPGGTWLNRRWILKQTQWKCAVW